MDDLRSPDALLAAHGARLITPPRMVGALRLMSVTEALALPARRYLLPGLIAPGEISAWWGAPKCGKTFLVMRLAYGMALGRGMWGREPGRPVRVLYGAAEGEGGIGTRLAALHDAMGDPADAFAVIAQRMQLGPPGEHLADFIGAARDHRAEVVVVDTLARTFGEGDEDRAQDMGGFITSLDRLREEGRRKGEPMPHVAVIHHGSKDPNAKTPRGSGALLGAADLVVRIKRGEAGAPSLATVEHAKDDADGAEMPFRLRVVEVASRGGAEPRLTCLAEEAEADDTGAARSASSLAPRQKTAMGFLHDAIAADGEPLPDAWQMPAGLQSISIERWADECERRSLTASDNPKNRRDVFNRVAGELRDRKAVAMRDGRVWLYDATAKLSCRLRTRNVLAHPQRDSARQPATGRRQGRQRATIFQCIRSDRRDRRQPPYRGVACRVCGEHRPDRREKGRPRPHRRGGGAHRRPCRAGARPMARRRLRRPQGSR